MGPNPNGNANATASTPRRQSCDRCHDQKLRCTRPNNRKTGACDRCLRKGAQCAYSSSLPKGRPSLYRLNEAATEANKITGSSSSSGKSSSTSSTPPTTEPETPDVTTTTTVGPSILPMTPLTPMQHRKEVPMASQAALADAAAFDMDMDGSSALALADAADNTDFWASWWPDYDMPDSNNMFDPATYPSMNLDPTLEPQPLPNLEFSGIYPPNTTLSEDFGFDTDFFDTTTAATTTADMGAGSSMSASHALYTTDKNGFDLSIAHLSRLSTRLSQLLGSSRSFLAQALDPTHQSRSRDPALQVQLSIEAVFQSINTWLAHGSVDTDTTTASSSSSSSSSSAAAGLCPSNAFDLLHHVFSASNHLIEILRHVRASVASSSTAASSPSSVCPSPSSSSSIFGSGTSRRGRHAKPRRSSSVDSTSSTSHSVVHHLVLVCVSLLLNMYVAILIALQRSADAVAARAPPRAEPADRMDAHSRAHLQLVAVVQLCAYFIKRQNQTLDSIASGSGGGGGSAFASAQDRSVSGDSMGELKAEVEQRLSRLQDCLCIVT